MKLKEVNEKNIQPGADKKKGMGIMILFTGKPAERGVPSA